MSFLPAALAVAGPLIKGIGQFKAANAAAANSRMQAREEATAANAEALRVRDDARRAIGQQYAAQAGNGMVAGTGSAIDALFESQVNAALDVMELRRQGMTRSYALNQQARQQKREGRWALAGALVSAADGYMGQKNDWAQARAGTSGGGS